MVFNVRISGTGFSIPDRIVTNREIEEMIGYSSQLQPGWIAQRTGIKERRWVDGKVDQISMAVDAADMALKNSGSKSIDAIIVARSRYIDERSLTLAGPVHAGLKKRSYTLNNVDYIDGFYVCSGALTALHDAALRIQSGIINNALVVSSSVGSAYCSVSHPGTTCIWADGAGAMVVERSENCGLLHYQGRGLSEFWNIFPLKEGVDKNQYVDMNGRKVYRGVIENVPPLIKQTIQKAGIFLKDIDLFIFHQANKRLIDDLVCKLEISEEKVFTNVERLGNTSSASMLIAYHEAKQQEKIREGSFVCFAGFGAGFHINCAVYKEN